MTDRTYAGRTAEEWRAFFNSDFAHFTAEIALQEALTRIEELEAELAASYQKLEAIAEEAIRMMPFIAAGHVGQQAKPRPSCSSCHGTGTTEWQARYTDGSWSRSIAVFPCPYCRPEDHKAARDAEVEDKP